MRNFFSRLNYTFGNEDWNVERKALQIAPNNHVLCITASGDRPLNLLIDPCKKLTSLDANPLQNHLLHLKSTALRRLGFEDYLQFLGAVPSAKRADLFQEVWGHLPRDSAKFWSDNKKLIAPGVLYQGQVEKLTRFSSKIVDKLRPNKIKRLFEIDNLSEQRDYVKKEWDTYLFRKTFDLFFCKTLCRIANFDPGLYSHVDPNISLGAYIYQRMLKSLDRTLAKENMILSLIFRGFVGKEAFPPYLTQESSPKIRERLSALSVETGDIIHFLEAAPKESIDRFSLSDVASYLDAPSYYRMMKGVVRAAKPDARFCIRQFSSNHTIPEDLKQHFNREMELERQLEEEDTSFIYRFNVGTIVK